MYSDGIEQSRSMHHYFLLIWMLDPTVANTENSLAAIECQ